MTRLSIALPESMKRFVEEQTAKGAYSTPSAYLEALIREAQTRTEHEEAEREELEQALVEGLDSPVREMAADDWRHLRQRVLNRHPGFQNG